MSLQTRLAALISAIGADIKADRARLTVLEGTPGRQSFRGALQSAAGYTALAATPRPSNTAQRVAIANVPAGDYTIHASLSGYFGSVTAAPWNVYIELPNATIVNPIVTSAFYINAINTHLTAPPASGDFTVPSGGGTIYVWPGVGGLLTSSDDRFDFVIIPKSMGGPPGIKGDTGSTGAQGPAGDAPASYTMDTWKTVGAGGQPAFANSWAAYPGEVAQFRKDPFGVVKCRGVVSSGTVALPIFTLPVGYRPPRQMVYLVQAATGTAAMVVSTAGAVYINNYFGTGSNAYVYLDEVEFDTDTITTFLSGPKGDKGDVGLPPVVVRAVGTTAVSGLTSGTYMGPLSLTVEGDDTDGFWNGLKFQPTKPGWYEVSLSVVADTATGTAADFWAYLVKNRTGAYPATGTTEGRDYKRIFPAQGETAVRLAITQVVYLNGSTDFIEMFMQGTSGTLQQSQSSVAIISVGAVGPAGAKGDKGDTGATGAAGSAIVDMISWQPLNIRTDSGGWTADPTAPPMWMLSPEGMVYLRGRLKATSLAGADYNGVYPFLQPYTKPTGTVCAVPGVNYTQFVAGVWELFNSGILWHGAKAVNDFFNLDGICYPSAIGGPLGRVVAPSLASGWTSDPTNPLKVYSDGDNIRFVGAVLGSLPGSGNTLIFTVPGLSVHTRAAAGSGSAATVSGPQHPSTVVLDGADFVVGSDGTVRVTPQWAGTNSCKLTFSGIWANAELE